MLYSLLSLHWHTMEMINSPDYTFPTDGVKLMSKWFVLQRISKRLKDAYSVPLIEQNVFFCNCRQQNTRNCQLIRYFIIEHFNWSVNQRKIASSNCIMSWWFMKYIFSIHEIVFHNIWTRFVWNAISLWHICSSFAPIGWIIYSKALEFVETVKSNKVFGWQMCNWLQGGCHTTKSLLHLTIFSIFSDSEACNRRGCDVIF